MQEIKITIDSEHIQEAINSELNKEIKHILKSNEESFSLGNTMKQLLDTGTWGNKYKSTIEKNLDWAIDSCFNTAIHESIEEIGLKDVIKAEVNKIISDPEWIKEIAKKKVEAMF